MGEVVLKGKVLRGASSDQPVWDCTDELKSVGILIVQISFTFVQILNWSVAAEILTDTCD